MSYYGIRMNQKYRQLIIIRLIVGINEWTNALQKGREKFQPYYSLCCCDSSGREILGGNARWFVISAYWRQLNHCKSVHVLQKRLLPARIVNACGFLLEKSGVLMRFDSVSDVITITNVECFGLANLPFLKSYGIHRHLWTHQSQIFLAYQHSLLVLFSYYIVGVFVQAIKYYFKPSQGREDVLQ